MFGPLQKVTDPSAARAERTVYDRDRSRVAGRRMTDFRKCSARYLMLNVSEVGRMVCVQRLDE